VTKPRSPTPRTREEALRLLKAAPLRVEERTSFVARAMRPEDAWLVARLMFSIYGEDYSHDYCYIPERFAEKLERGEILASVAQIETGDVVGYAALYRTSSPNARVFEIGKYVIAPPYRGSLALARVQAILLEKLLPEAGADAVIGEVVCTHTRNQRMTSRTSFRETGFEVGLLPAAPYRLEGADSGAVQDSETQPDESRASFVVFSCLGRNERLPQYAPAFYEEALAWIGANLELSRDRRPTKPGALMSLEQAHSDLSPCFFDSVGALRCNVGRVGRDFEQRMDQLEAEARTRGVLVMQMILDLGSPEAATGARVLRERGYFLGVLLPSWFGTDGLLMQKIATPPQLASIRIHTELGRSVFELVAADLAQVDPSAAAGLRAALVQDESKNGQIRSI
jgi:hypothetical protein